jgi:hypothetical protein
MAAAATASNSADIAQVFGPHLSKALFLSGYEGCIRRTAGRRRILHAGLWRDRP